MKNIHLLSIVKPSRLFYNKTESKFIIDDDFENTIKEDWFQDHNIYITSDEEIKVGVYYFDKLSMKPLKCIGDEYFNNVDEKKIILTTDQDLIKDGVQEIDDEFLEWFVKNPSCKSVEVTKMLQVRHGVAWYDLPNQKEGRELEGIYRKVYKIIILQKEL